MEASDRVRIGRRGDGYFAESTRFYVWEEDPVELFCSASDLAVADGRGRLPSSLPLEWQLGARLSLVERR